MNYRKLLTLFSMMVIAIIFVSVHQQCFAINVEQSVVNDNNGNVLYATTRSYNAQNKVTEVKTVDLKNKVLVDYIYDYDKNNNVINEKDNVNGNYRQFGYDLANQLTSERYYDLSGKLLKEISYQYDLKGNRTQKIVSYDNSLETTGYEYNKQNQITKVNNQEYVYDDNGNLVQDGKKTNTYNSKGELIQVKQDNKVIESYQYNQDGARVKKESDKKAEVYSYNDGQLSSITDATGKQKITFARDTNGNLVSMSDSQNTYWYLFDGLWNVKGLADKNGDKVVSYEYDAWGLCTESQGSEVQIVNPFRFMSYQYDSTTGYYYLGARYYDPQTGRFIGADGYTKDALITSNLYKYANNNPLRYKDSTGHWEESIDSKLPEWAQEEIRSLTVGWNYAVTDEAKDRIHAKANCIRAYAEKQNPTTLKGISGAFTVSKGSSGDDVRALQQALKDAGRTLVVDGKFGSNTDSTLKQYQSSSSLLSDGVAGMNTWVKLGEVYYGVNYSKLSQGLGNAVDDVNLKIGYYDIDEAYIENGTTYANVYDTVFALKGRIEPYGHGTNDLVAIFYPTRGANAYLQQLVVIHADEIDDYSIRKLAEAAGYGDKITFTNESNLGSCVNIDIDNTPLNTGEAVKEVLQFIDNCNMALMTSGIPICMGVSEGIVVAEEAGETVIKELSTLTKAELVAESAEITFSSGKAGELFLEKLVGGASKSLETSFGRRFIDRLVGTIGKDAIAHESKVGYKALTSFIKRQIDKDVELITNGTIKSSVWHFYKSATTGKIGASSNLLEYLKNKGIKVLIDEVEVL